MHPKPKSKDAILLSACIAHLSARKSASPWGVHDASLGVEIGRLLHVQAAEAHRPQQLLGKLLWGLALQQHGHVDDHALGGP